MRTDRLYLEDILGACESIHRFIDGVEEEEFSEDELRQSAVLQKLVLIGEAAARIDRRLKGNHPEVEWSDIVAFRNIAVHAYFRLDWEVVWITALRDIPLLESQIKAIMTKDFPALE